MPNISDHLPDFNPWWKEDFATEFKERSIYGEIGKFLPLPQILALTGLRRVGKTTLMKKIAEDGVRKGIDPGNIIYFSFDEFREVEIRDVLKEYERLMERDIRKGKYMLLLDELQKVGNWDDQLKSIYDTHGKRIKTIISGSESLFIRRKSRETLAGRLFEFKVEPLTFREFLHFKGTAFEPVGLHERELVRSFSEFTLTLGLPEMVGIKDKDIIRKYVKESIVEKVVYRDIPGMFGIRDASVIESMLNIFMEAPGQLAEVSELSKELGVSRQTVSVYLRYLEESFLIRKLYNYSRSRRKVERKLKKYYPTLVSVDLLFKGDELSSSRTFEWMLVSQLRAEFFWRDPYKNEVDIVLAGKGAVPVEIKRGKTDFKGLLAFMKKFNVKKGYVISPEREETHRTKGKVISVVPAYKFLLK